MYIMSNEYKRQKPLFLLYMSKKNLSKMLIRLGQKKKSQNQVCNCPYCKKELPLEQWNKINSFLENRKNEAERMKVLNQYELNKNLYSIKLEDMKQENIKLKMKQKNKKI